MTYRGKEEPRLAFTHVAVPGQGLTYIGLDASLWRTHIDRVSVFAFP
jgi:hypothetical protein